MFVRPFISAGALGAACGLLLGCGSSAPGPAATRTASAAAATHASGNGTFSLLLAVNNPMFPLAVGTQFSYQGKIVQDGESKPHTVTFTVTDVSKVVDGVKTVVAWDRDFLEGKLQEQELAFFAQDDQGNVWNFGEYPEEYENGKFTGAPSTWIRGVDGAYGGIHMLSQPRTGMKYREGLVAAIEFDDVSVVARTGQQTCLAGTCYKQVLVVDETSPNDPASGHQIKHLLAADRARSRSQRAAGTPRSPHAGLGPAPRPGRDGEDTHRSNGHGPARLQDQGVPDNPAC